MAEPSTYPAAAEPAAAAGAPRAPARSAPFLVRGTLLLPGGQPKMLHALVPPTATVGQLRQAFAAQLSEDGTPDLTMVSKGMMIEEDAKSLDDVDLVPTPERQIPSVHLCKRTAFHADVAQKQQQQQQQQVQQPQQPYLAEHLRRPHPEASSIGADATGERVCRLCFDGEVNEETGRLFSPCRCSGTMRYIHVNCLNAWRQRSQNAVSFYQCDQCMYQYSIERTRWAGLLLSPRTIGAAAVLLLALATLMVGSATAWMKLHVYVWEFIHYSPLDFWGTKVCQSPECNSICNSWDLWNWQAKCGAASCVCSLAPSTLQHTGVHVVSAGVLVVSVVGLYAVREMLMVNWWILVLALISAQGGSHARLFIAVGVGHAYFTVHRMVHKRAKAVMTRWGEKVLDVTAAAPQD
eukprot:TRINITY_DN1370_c3_g1_i1.p1 TRINITY_DN1370_c3_g1~~TRINITY_DN1370_c3_g1_i1.p1  ORF type:complete len:431 (+),score=155.71 TRINITY_DN1370_c3_g1_i1:74-1294(+)